MANITGSAPILLVADVVAAANYYRACVGFAYDQFHGEPPNFCILHRDGHHLMLAQASPGDIWPHWRVVDKMWNVYFWVDDARAIYDEVKQRGAMIDYELHTKPYGCREFGIQDLDGYDIAFGQVLESK
jgi:predicted enzyme related to lactoylglutathione lyase